VQERSADAQPVRDLPHTAVEHGVARDPKDAVLLPLPPKCEADHVAGQQVTHWRAMSAGRGRDLDLRSSGRFHHRRDPWLEAAGVATEALRAGDGHDHGARRRRQRAAGGVEVVVVLIVAEQHHVDRSNVRGGDRRAGQLARPRTPAEPVAPSGGIERGIGEQAPASGFDQDRGPADVCKGHFQLMLQGETSYWPI
jgi:hypothetical protein